jgi:hypothetical protein
MVDILYGLIQLKSCLLAARIMHCSSFISMLIEREVVYEFKSVLNIEHITLKDENAYSKPSTKRVVNLQTNNSLSQSFYPN